MDKPAFVPDEFDVLTVVILRLTDDPPDLDEQAAAELQRAHLEYGQKLKAEGYTVANGPLIQSSDDRLRGISIYRVPPGRAKELAEGDPGVAAGRFEMVSAGWCTFPGLIDFPTQDEPVAERISFEEMQRRW